MRSLLALRPEFSEEFMNQNITVYPTVLFISHILCAQDAAIRSMLCFIILTHFPFDSDFAIKLQYHRNHCY